jgi:hypothetical protein
VQTNPPPIRITPVAATRRIAEKTPHVVAKSHQTSKSVLHLKTPRAVRGACRGDYDDYMDGPSGIEAMSTMGELRRGWGLPPARAVVWRLRIASILIGVCTTWGSVPCHGFGEDEPAQIVIHSPCAVRLQPGDELWVVSTRHLGWPRHCSDFQPVVRRYLADGWRESSLEHLADATPMTTVVYVHGNRFTYRDSIEKGFQTLSVLAHGIERPTMRFIIWSWPSERVPGPFRDVRMKAERADVEGYYLACFLTQLPAEIPFRFIAHSFGARVVGGSIQALASGQLRGVELAEDHSYPVFPVRVALLAAAIDGDIFLPRREFGDALQQVDQLLVMFNPYDPVLKYYALIDRYRRPRALGSVGMPSVRRADGPETRIRQLNVARVVGHSHIEDRYYASPSLMAEVRQVLLGDDPAFSETAEDTAPAPGSRDL